MFESLLSLIFATTILLGSPGPAPLALAGTSATFGVARGVPFLLGILTGLTVAVFAASVGLAALLTQYPAVKVVLQLAGGLYILYVATKIATAPVISRSDDQGRRAPTFLDGFILNLLNPKAYAAFVAIFSQFLLPIEPSSMAFLITGIICIMVATVVDAAWLLFGGLLKPIFYQPTPARIVRIIFAVLMVGAVLWAYTQ